MKESQLTRESVLQAFPELLLQWFSVSARDLPWRHTDDPYAIWVSEIMLQQTRVAAVLGYYARFLAAFPTVEALANAPEERLLKLWEGMGYYSRARNLQKAARLVAEEYGGKLPASYPQLLALPGVGDYTASAIASAAFGERQPAVDGNVYRVITRITDCHEPITDTATKRRIRDWVGAVMPTEPGKIRIFNQATMDLGATVCVPNGAPRCEVCPLREICLGRIRGTAESLPVKATKKERRTEEKTVLLLLREGRVALRRRAENGLLAGLWEFPNLPGRRTEQETAEELGKLGLTVREWHSGLQAKHIFTHVEWHMTGYTLEVEGEGAPELTWMDSAELRAHAVPSAFAKYYAAAEALLKEEGP